MSIRQGASRAEDSMRGCAVEQRAEDRGPRTASEKNDAGNGVESEGAL